MPRRVFLHARHRDGLRNRPGRSLPDVGGESEQTERERQPDEQAALRRGEACRLARHLTSLWSDPSSPAPPAPPGSVVTGMPPFCEIPQRQQSPAFPTASLPISAGASGGGQGWGHPHPPPPRQHHSPVALSRAAPPYTCLTATALPPAPSSQGVSPKPCGPSVSSWPHGPHPEAPATLPGQDWLWRPLSKWGLASHQPGRLPPLRPSQTDILAKHRREEKLITCLDS